MFKALLKRGYFWGFVVGHLLVGYSMGYFEVYQLLCLNISEITWLAVVTNSLPLLLAAIIGGIAIDRLLIGKTIPAFPFFSVRKRASVVGAVVGGLLGAGLMPSFGVQGGYFVGVLLTMPLGYHLMAVGVFIGITLMCSALVYVSSLFGSCCGALIGRLGH